MDKKEFDIKEYIIEKKKALMNSKNGMEELEGRLDLFKDCIEDFECEVVKHAILCDCYMCFYDGATPESIDNYIIGTLGTKMETLNNGTLVNIDEMFDRVFGFGDVLLFSARAFNDPFYLYAFSKMMYTLLGEDRLIENINLSLYAFPPKKDGFTETTEKTEDLSKEHMERMFQ